MIILNLAIHDGEVEVMEFKTVEELIEFIEELKRFDCIWLVADESDINDDITSSCEILITEDVYTIISAIGVDFFSCSLRKDSKLFIQEYQSYEDAYKVALDMREGNPKCYN